MIDLMPIAQAFVNTLQEDEVKADKEAVAELVRLSDGDEEVYINLRNQLGEMINELLHSQLRAESDAAKSEVEASEEVGKDMREAVEVAEDKVEAETSTDSE